MCSSHSYRWICVGLQSDLCFWIWEMGLVFCGHNSPQLFKREENNKRRKHFKNKKVSKQDRKRQRKAKKKRQDKEAALPLPLSYLCLSPQAQASSPNLQLAGSYGYYYFRLVCTTIPTCKILCALDRGLLCRWHSLQPSRP